MLSLYQVHQPFSCALQVYTQHHDQFTCDCSIKYSVLSFLLHSSVTSCLNTASNSCQHFPIAFDVSSTYCTQFYAPPAPNVLSSWTQISSLSLEISTKCHFYCCLFQTAFSPSLNLDALFRCLFFKIYKYRSTEKTTIKLPSSTAPCQHTVTPPTAKLSLMFDQICKAFTLGQENSILL